VGIASLASRQRLTFVKWYASATAALASDRGRDPDAGRVGRAILASFDPAGDAPGNSRA
jgi:hypothetical protein